MIGREKIKELYYKQNKTESEIATELKLSQESVKNYIYYLKTQKNIEERRKRVEELTKQGKSYNEIAKELKVSISTVRDDIRYLKNPEEIEANKKSTKIEKRREKVKELYNQDKTIQEIADELGVSIATVSNDIKYLIEQKEIKSKIEKRRERVKELYNQDKTVEEIADELGVSIATISNDIKYLIEQKEIKSRIEKRRERVKELYNQDKTIQEIADELGVSTQTVRNDIECLKNPQNENNRNTKKLDNRKENKKGKEIDEEQQPKQEIEIKQLIANFRGQAKTKKELKKYILECKIRYIKGLLKKQELSTIKEIVELLEDYESLAFYIKLNEQIGNFQEALKFANIQIKNESLTRNRKR